MLLAKYALTNLCRRLQVLQCIRIIQLPIQAVCNIVKCCCCGYMIATKCNSLYLQRLTIEIQCLILAVNHSQACSLVDQCCSIGGTLLAGL